MLYTRGMMISMLQVEAIRAAQEKYGKGKVDDAASRCAGASRTSTSRPRSSRRWASASMMRPIKTSCSNHMGTDWARIDTWDGGKWNVTSDWYQADKTASSTPMVKEYAAEVREGQEHQAARLQLNRAAWPPSPPSAAGRSAAAARRQRHRGHLQPRDPRAQGRVAHGAGGRHRGAARRQRRGQDDHAARRLATCSRASAAR